MLHLSKICSLLTSRTQILLTILPDYLYFVVKDPIYTGSLKFNETVFFTLFFSRVTR